MYQQRRAPGLTMSAHSVARQLHLDHPRSLFADLALVATFACIFALCAVSATLLENLGFHYAMPGGFPWEKFHPATFLAATALTLRIASSRTPTRAATSILAADPALVLYMVAVVIAAIHALTISGLPFTGLIDTFVLPAMLLALLGTLRTTLRRKAALLVCVLIGGNAVIALIEFLTGWRIVPVAIVDTATVDPSDFRAAASGDWRATALLGHPLQNAVITGAFLVCLASRGCRWMDLRLRVFLISLCLCAMVAFGGRASLVLVLIALAVLLTGTIGRILAAGQALPLRALAVCLIAVPFVASATLIIAGEGFFDKLLERFVNDQGSAEARVLMWDLFNPFSWSSILLGPDPEVVTLHQHLLGIELGIESFWVAITLAYGLIVACLLFCGLGLFCLRLIASGRTGTTAVLLYYFVVASSSTSLSGKTTGLALVTMFILTMLDHTRPHNSADVGRKALHESGP